MIKEDKLILNEVFTEEISTTIDEFVLEHNGKEIKAIRTRVFNNNLGETDDSFEFESDMDLSDEDKKTIENFCYEQQ